MKSLCKFSLIVVSVCLLASCGRVKKPILDYNEPFLEEYGNDINKLKKKHKKTMRNTRAELSEDRIKTNVESQRPKRIYFYDKSEDYIVVDGKIVDNKNGVAEKDLLFYSDSNVVYVDSNSGKFNTKERVLFSDIKIPEGRDAKYYNAKYGYKDYKSVNNMDMQESVDYITVINDVRTQKRKEIVKKKKLIEEQKVENKMRKEQEKEKKGFFGFFK